MCLRCHLFFWCLVSVVETLWLWVCVLRVGVAPPWSASPSSSQQFFASFLNYFRPYHYRRHRRWCPNLPPEFLAPGFVKCKLGLRRPDYCYSASAIIRTTYYPALAPSDTTKSLHAFAASGCPRSHARNQTILNLQLRPSS